MSDEGQHVLIVGEAASGRANTKVTVLGQVNVLDARTNLVVGEIVGEASVVADRDGSLVVFYFDTNGKRLVAEVSQTAT